MNVHALTDTSRNCNGSIVHPTDIEQNGFALLCFLRQRGGSKATISLKKRDRTNGQGHQEKGMEKSFRTLVAAVAICISTICFAADPQEQITEREQSFRNASDKRDAAAMAARL